jgi:hypothetical protein
MSIDFDTRFRLSWFAQSRGNLGLWLEPDVPISPAIAEGLEALASDLDQLIRDYNALAKGPSTN